MTKRLAQTFQDLHQLCVQQLRTKPNNQIIPQQNQQPENQIKTPNNQEVNIKREEPEKEKKIRKRKSKPPSHKPKNPPSSFLIFYNDQYKNIAESNPGLKSTELTKIAGEQWSKLTPDQKQPYINQNLQEKRRYQKKMEKYRIMYPEQIIAKKSKTKTPIKEPPSNINPSNIKLQESSLHVQHQSANNHVQKSDVIQLQQSSNNPESKQYGKQGDSLGLEL